MSNNFQRHWDMVHSNYDMSNYDLWLDQYLSSFNRDSFVLDLGCGQGNNVKYLIERGFQVVAADYSDRALEITKSNNPTSLIVKCDLMGELPFRNDFVCNIVADLSLHYFDDEMTKEIMLKLKKIMKKEAVLLARVNSNSDVNFGSDRGELLESNYYFTDGYNKRFFDEEDVVKYFSLIGDVTYKENSMNRYGREKKLFEVMLKKQ